MSEHDGWVADVLKFWFEESEPDQWFVKDPRFDASIRNRFHGLHEMLVCRGNHGLLADAQTALAAVIVLDQMSRNMFRGTPRAFAADQQALRVAETALVRGFDAGLTKDQRLFLYLPFQHAEDRQLQARAVELTASLGDPELQKWAEAHRAIVDRSGAFRIAMACLDETRPQRKPSFSKNRTAPSDLVDGLESGFGEMLARNVPS
jgi:uncharacterized protein (DUF924 family)